MPTPTVTKQFFNRRITNTLDGIVVVEVFKFSGLPHGDADSWQSYARPKGLAHPRVDLYPGALLRGYVLIDRINPTTLLGGEVFSSNVRYSGGPRPISSATGIEGEIEVPIWLFYDFDGTPMWLRGGRFIPRMVAIRSETRFVAGVTIGTIQQAIALNIGRLYTIDGDFYVLSGESSAYTDGLGLTRIDYRFRTNAAMPGFPVNTPGFNNAVAIPFLPPLFIWYDTPGDPPVITVVPQDTLLLTGGPLPGFP